MGESHRRELGGAIDAQLDPVPLAPGAVGRILSFGDDAFETEVAHRTEHRLALLLDVLDVPQGAARAGGKEPAQEPLAQFERPPPPNEIAEREEVEPEKRRGKPEPRPG